MQHNQMRIQGYISLSQMLQRPTEDLPKLINSEEFCNLWQQIKETYNTPLPASWEGEALPELTDWTKMWVTTMGPIKPLAEPIESLYKIWTTDKSCEISIANQKGYLRSDWACHMEQLLNDAGLEIPSRFAHCPDHLVLEMEFFSMLIEEEATEAAQLEFFEHHLDWLKDLYDSAQEKNAPQIYQDLYYLCLQFTQADEKFLKS